MKLFELIDRHDFIETNIHDNIEISSITTDSRKSIPKDTLFVCLEGLTFDAHNYIFDVMERGAAAVIVQRKPTDESVPYILVANTRQTEASLWMKWYGNPAENIKIIGITGTKGKSSVGLFLYNILRAAGYKTAFLGTFKNYIVGDEEIPVPADSPPSTPDPESLAKLFKQMNEKGIHYAIMDVSSHALALDRVSAMRFDFGIFTNLGHDHLDFHKSMENYMLAKAKLFQLSNVAVMNYDDEATKKIAALSEAKKYYYSTINSEADFYASDIEYIGEKGDIFNLHFAGNNIKMCSSIHGLIYIYNALAAAGVALLIGVPKEIIYNALQDTKMAGRMEKLETNSPFSVYIDYAHTPNSLLGMLVSFKDITPGRVIVVFGCGGDRDKTKRPIMGRIATENSDYCIITSDNPRNEDPLAIIDDIVKGIENHHSDSFTVIPDRKEAIIHAIGIAKENDIVILAGKGHEEYIKDAKGVHRFNEKEIVFNELNKRYQYF